MISSPIIDKLLSDQTYHIEFNGHLTNHVKHAVIALTKLGMHDEKVLAYYKNYAKETPYGFGLEPARPDKLLITEQNWKNFLGKRVGYTAFCNFFDRQEKKLGLNRVLNAYLPILLEGWAGAFTHATIHLGWALDINHRWMIIEGLSYMAYTYVSCHPDRVPLMDEHEKISEHSIIDSFLKITEFCEDNKIELTNEIENLFNDPHHTFDDIHPELLRSGLQFRIACLLEQGHPEIYKTAGSLNHQPTPEIWEQLFYVVTLLYLEKPGNFVILHLITSLHAMGQISRHVSHELQNKILKCFWIGMLCILFSERYFPNKSKLIALNNIFNSKIDSEESTRLWEENWHEIMERAFLEDEEHNPKLVYVLRLLWQRTNKKSIYRAAAAQFTTTPILPPSFENKPE